MADERRIDAVTAKKVFLERQNNRGLRHNTRQLGDSSFSPRPHLGSDIVKNRHARIERGFGGFHVESRIIDDYEKPDVSCRDSPPDFFEELPVPGDMPNHLDEAHDTGLVPVEERHAGLFHERPAKSCEVEIRPQLSKLLSDARRVEIARGLSSDEDDLRHCPLPRRR